MSKILIALHRATPEIAQEARRMRQAAWLGARLAGPGMPLPDGSLCADPRNARFFEAVSIATQVAAQLDTRHRFIA